MSIRFSLLSVVGMSRLTRDGLVEPVSRDQTLRRERGQGNIHFACSADHERLGLATLYPVDPYSCYMCDYTYIYIYYIHACAPAAKRSHFTSVCVLYRFLKKNQNAPRPSEHPPVRGKKMSKRFGGIKGCKYKTSSWFPDMEINSVLSGRNPPLYCTLIFISMHSHQS